MDFLRWNNISKWVLKFKKDFLKVRNIFLGLFMVWKFCVYNGVDIGKVEL